MQDSFFAGCSNFLEFCCHLGVARQQEGAPGSYCTYCQELGQHTSSCKTTMFHFYAFVFV